MPRCHANSPTPDFWGLTDKTDKARYCRAKTTGQDVDPPCVPAAAKAVQITAPGIPLADLQLRSGTRLLGRAR